MQDTPLSIAIVSRRSLIRELVSDYCTTQGFDVTGSFHSLHDINAAPGSFSVLLHVSGGDTTIGTEIDRFKEVNPEARIIVVCSKLIRETAVMDISPKVEALIIDDSSLRALTGALTLVQEGFRLTPPPAQGRRDGSLYGQPEKMQSSARSLTASRETLDQDPDVEGDMFEGEDIYDSDPVRARAFARLSSRERAVIRKLREGASNKDIAKDLDIGESTVKVHLRSCYRKIGVRNRTQAAMWVTKHIPN